MGSRLESFWALSLSTVLLGAILLGCGPVKFSLDMAKVRHRTHIGMPFEEALTLIENTTPSWGMLPGDVERSIRLLCRDLDDCAASPQGWQRDGWKTIDWSRYLVVVGFYRPPDGINHMAILYLVFDKATMRLVAKVSPIESDLAP